MALAPERQMRDTGAFVKTAPVLASTRLRFPYRRAGKGRAEKAGDSREGTGGCQPPGSCFFCPFRGVGLRKRGFPRRGSHRAQAPAMAAPMAGARAPVCLRTPAPRERLKVRNRRPGRSRGQRSRPGLGCCGIGPQAVRVMSPNRGPPSLAKPLLWVFFAEQSGSRHPARHERQDAQTQRICRHGSTGLSASTSFHRGLQGIDPGWLAEPKRSRN